MDTASDFIQPEFLNIIFFQQKNLVVFPYVDLKHLHGLEIFTAGYNVVDLESTALHNLKEILEFESTNSYSQSPTLYFIYNVDREKVKELMELNGIRCIINSNENITNLANGSKFIFYNKKNNQFLNYDIDDSELQFEQTLIKDSQDKDILQENIQKIKIVATRIFKELNQTGTLETLPDILSEYKKKYWQAILDFTSKYYDINIPDISGIKFKPRKTPRDYSDEYEVLISTNRALGKEFIQLVHEYRSKKVNAAHLELDELYNPQKLYNYLRNHHWKDGIPDDFIQEWSQMNISNYTLTDEDQSDFASILGKLDLRFSIQKSPQTKPPPFLLEIEVKHPQEAIFIVPSIKTEWNKYRKWILNRLEDLEQLIHSKNRRSGINSYLLDEILNLKKLIEENKKKFLTDVPNLHEAFPLPKSLKEEVISGMTKLKIQDWVELYGISDRFRFVVRFITQFDVLYEDIFGKDGVTDTPPRIKKFRFPPKLENNLMAFNRVRNRITHREMTDEQINTLLKSNEDKISNTYFNFLSYLLKSQIQYIAKKYNFNNNDNLNQFVFEEYLSDSIFSEREKSKIQELLN